MSDHYILDQQGAEFDITALSPRAMNRVVQYGDMEAERLYKEVISMARIGMAAERAFAISAHLDNYVENAIALCPEAAKDLKRIKAIATRELCEILEGYNQR